VTSSTEWVGFAPWVGEGYASLPAHEPRLLILGESHYDKPEAQVIGYTQMVVQKHVFWRAHQRKAQKFRRSPFFGKMTALVLDRRAAGAVTESESHELWHRIAFGNFVPVLVGCNRTYRPTDAMWELGRKRFFQLLAELRPDAVIACGLELWNHLPPPESEEQRVLDGADPWLERRYALADGHRTRMVRVAHPAERGWKYDRWRPRVRDVLSKQLLS
jgi:hypothetical protein